MIGATLYSLLSGNAGVAALVGTRIYPQVRPQADPLPALVYTVVDDIPAGSLAGWTSGLSNARVQIDAYAKGYIAAETLADAVRTALATSTLPMSRRDGYEDETQLYRVSQDFSMWVSKES